MIIEHTVEYIYYDEKRWMQRQYYVKILEERKRIKEIWITVRQVISKQQKYVRISLKHSL